MLNNNRQKNSKDKALFELLVDLLNVFKANYSNEVTEFFVFR